MAENGQVRIHCEVGHKAIGVVLYGHPDKARDDLRSIGVSVLGEQLLDSTGNRVWQLTDGR